MGVLVKRPAARWAAPVAALAVVAVVGVGAAASASADDQPVLPPISAEQLLADVQQPTTTALSGTVTVHADLGLPEIPGLTGAVAGSGVVPGGAASVAPGTRLNQIPTDGATAVPALDGLTGLLSGDHTLRVWADAPDRARLAVIGDGEESDVVKNGTDLWLWQSSGKQALHATLPSPDDLAAQAPTPDQLPDDLAQLLAQLPTTPQDAASRLLAAVEPTTAVTVESTASVAGRPAYQLVATPKDGGSLVSRVVVAVDAQTHVPLRLDVYSTRLVDPAFSVGFASVSFATPPADVFAFTPPAGATVTEVPDDLANLTGSADVPQRSGAAAHPDVTTVGEGWATVVVLTPTGTASFGRTDGSSEGGAAGILDALPQVSGPWGTGHALAGTLFSVLVADDGRIAAGAVPVEALEDALASTAP
jgi:outer membrane lipoprotein-sorting protein